MKKRPKFFPAIMTASLVLAVGAGCSDSKNNAGKQTGEPRGWGRGDLGVAERAFYSARVMRTIKKWQEAGINAARGEDGRIAQPYPVFLVIDTEKGAIWIENGGKTEESSLAELPKNMTWRVLRNDRAGPRELAIPARFKTRGVYTGQITPENIHLVGEGRGVGHLEFHFGSSGSGSSFGTGPTQLAPFKNARKKTGEYYGSIVVTEKEYEAFRQSHDGTSIQAQDLSRDEHVEAAIAENRAAWLRAEKWIYAAIVKQVAKAGFDLERLEVKSGPDFSAAHTEIRAGRRGPLSSLMGQGGSRESYLKIDYLGDDIWYVKSAPHPTPPMFRKAIAFEFLASAAGEVPESETAKRLEQGREKQRVVTRPQSKWVAMLPNGATVEFIGICESPSGGKKWWGPDGSPLAQAPYFNAVSMLRHRDDRNVYEIAWRIHWPVRTGGGSGGGVHSSLEGSHGSGFRSVDDRYGNRIDGLDAQGYAFDKSRTTTTLKLGVRTGGSKHQWVLFRNISLVPGENPGFRIEVDK